MERLESKENLFFKYRIERPLKAKEGETVLKVACLALMVVSVALLTSLVFFPGAVVPLLIVSGAVLVLVPAGIGRYLFIRGDEWMRDQCLRGLSPEDQDKGMTFFKEMPLKERDEGLAIWRQLKVVVSIDTFCNLWESEFFKARTFEEKTYAVRTITSAYFNDGAPELENDTRNTSIRMEIEALGHSNSQEFSDLLRQAFLRRRDFWPGGAEPKGGTPDAREAAAKARDGNREMVDEVGREAGVDARIECLKRLIERRLDKEKSGSSARPHALAFWPS